MSFKCLLFFIQETWHFWSLENGEKEKRQRQWTQFTSRKRRSHHDLKSLALNLETERTGLAQYRSYYLSLPKSTFKKEPEQKEENFSTKRIKTTPTVRKNSTKKRIFFGSDSKVTARKTKEPRSEEQKENNNSFSVFKNPKSRHHVQSNSTSNPVSFFPRAAIGAASRGVPDEATSHGRAVSHVPNSRIFQSSFQNGQFFPPDFQIDNEHLETIIRVEAVLSSICQEFKREKHCLIERNIKCLFALIESKPLDGIEIIHKPFSSKKSSFSFPKIIRMSFLLQTISLVSLLFYSKNPERLRPMRLHLKNLAHFARRNFLLFIEIILPKLSIHKHYEFHVVKLQKLLCLDPVRVSSKQRDPGIDLKQGNEMLFSLIRSVVREEKQEAQPAVMFLVKNFERISMYEAQLIMEKVLFSNVSRSPSVSLKD